MKKIIKIEVEKDNTVSYVEVLSDEANVKISCLLLDGQLSLWRDTESIDFLKDLGKQNIASWDNSWYIKKLVKSLRRGKNNKFTKELKEFCTEHDFIYESICSQILSVFCAAKKLGMFKKEKV